MGAARRTGATAHRQEIPPCAVVGITRWLRIFCCRAIKVDFRSMLKQENRVGKLTMRHSLVLGILGAVLQLTAASECSADESPLPSADYGVSTIWQLGGIGGWDYLALEPSGARLFISRGDRVDVVETASGRRAGIVANTPGVHGI